MTRYSCILADPPWESSGPGWLGGAARHYDPMPVEEIERLAVQEIRESNAHLWLWMTDWADMHGWHLQVARAWGFRPHVSWPWWKLSKHPLDRHQREAYERKGWPMVMYRGRLHGLRWPQGKWGRRCTETLVLAVRGKVEVNWSSPWLKRHRQIVAPWTGVHSEKPEETYDLVGSVTVPGPRVELFARGVGRLGWDAWGHQAEDPVELPL